MGDEPRGTQGTESLDSSVGTLLEDAYRTCERIEQTLAERPPPVETPPPPAASPSLDSDVGTLVKEARAATAVSDGVDPSLEVVGNLSELDSDLASLADNLFESETPASPAAPPGDQSAPVAAVAVPAASPVPTQATAPTSPASPAQQAQVTAAPKPPAAEPQAAEPAAPAIPVEQGLPPARDAAKILVGAIAPVTLTALDAMSFPLRNKPRVVRDTVGWLALWTLFLSGSLWVYVIFFHEPVGPAATAPALEFVGAEGRQPRVHASSEETKGESHEAKSADEHGGSEKASEASAEKSASKEDHGGH